MPQLQQQTRIDYENFMNFESCGSILFFIKDANPTMISK